jgi:hypothetical protein
MFYLSHSTNVNIFDKLQNKIDLINKNKKIIFKLKTKK